MIKIKAPCVVHLAQQVKLAGYAIRFSLQTRSPGGIFASIAVEFSVRNTWFLFQFISASSQESVTFEDSNSAPAVDLWSWTTPPKKENQNPKGPPHRVWCFASYQGPASLPSVSYRWNLPGTALRSKGNEACNERQQSPTTTAFTRTPPQQPTTRSTSHETEKYQKSKENLLGKLNHLDQRVIFFQRHTMLMLR